MARPKPVPVVLIHGLLSTPREFGLISLPLRAAGVNLITPHVVGYTEANRGAPKHWQAWVDAATSAIEEAVPKGEPFVLGGLCTGGLIAASAALQSCWPLRGLVLMSPTFAFDGWGQSKLWRWRRLAYGLHLTRFIATRERSPFGIKNEKLRLWVERDMARRATSAAGPSRLPLWAVRETERIASHVRSRIDTLPARKVVLHAREDEVCRLSVVERAFQAMSGDDNQLSILDNSFHMITLDNDRKRVADELLKAATHERLSVSPCGPGSGMFAS